MFFYVISCKTMLKTNQQINISILFVFILKWVSDLFSFAFSIVLYETINTFKVMFLSLDPIFLTHSHYFFTLFCFSPSNLCYLNCTLSSLTNLYLIKIFASSLDPGIHTAHSWPWALESKHLAMCFLLVAPWDKCNLLRVHTGENCSDSSLYKKPPEAAQVPSLKWVPFGREEI